jgi:hypothetical protein
MVGMVRDRSISGTSGDLSSERSNKPFMLAAGSATAHAVHGPRQNHPQLNALVVVVLARDSENAHLTRAQKGIIIIP